MPMLRSQGITGDQQWQRFIRHLKRDRWRHRLTKKHSVEDKSKEKDLDMADVEATFVAALEHHMILHVLNNLDSNDLAKLEACSSSFRKPANLDPDHTLSLPELAARTMCEARSLVKQMPEDRKTELKHRCGGSWKLVLMFLQSGERVRQHACPDVVAGQGHSVGLSKSGAVYTFGENNAGQLGHPLQTELWKPHLLSLLDGVRVTQAVAGIERTMLVTDTGHVYAFGRDVFGMTEYPSAESKLDDQLVNVPELVESLRGIAVVQIAMGYFFTAVLSQEGKVYTLSWGFSKRFGHACDADREARLLGGALADIPVVQIAGGHCFLLALAYEPKGMCVYSLGCGLGGKLGHGSEKTEGLPCRIAYFDEHTDFKPIAIAAGPWHAVALSEDGRVCTWGWAYNGCLGYRDDHESYFAHKNLPTVVAELVHRVKVVRISAGYNSTFAFAEDGEIYCFGETSLVQEAGYKPKLITNFKDKGEHVIRLSMTHAGVVKKHMLALTSSGKVYACGAGAGGQLGRQLMTGSRESSQIVDIDFCFK